MPEVVDVRLDHLDFMNERHELLLRAFSVRGIPLSPAPRAAASRSTRTGACRNVPEPGAARDVPAPLDAAGMSTAAPPGGRHERALPRSGLPWRVPPGCASAPERYAARMLPAKTIDCGAGARICNGVRTQSPPPGRTAHGLRQDGQTLFRTGCDSGCELLDETSSKPWMV